MRAKKAVCCGRSKIPVRIKLFLTPEIPLDGSSPAGGEGIIPFKDEDLGAPPGLLENMVQHFRFN